ncbi:DNA recombination protein RmuC [Allosphingosinicella humi]
MDPMLLVVVALLLGLAAGWFVGNRQAAAYRTERDGLQERCSTAEKAAAAAEERAKAGELLRMTLDEVTKERDAALREVSEMRADARNFEVRMKELLEAKEALSNQFSEVGAKLLSQAQDAFLKRANDRFAQAGEQHEGKIKALLEPVRETLARYESGVEKVEKDRREAYGNLTGLIEGMRAGQEAVRSEAAKLVNSLRSAPKARGRWGEQQLRNVLETCGLSDLCDFQAEVSVASEDGRLRPDVVVRVPGGRALVIDAKVSLNAYQDAFGAVDEEGRAAGLAAHAVAMKAHVNGLGNKAYWSQFDDAPDYVIMFVPGEHFLSAALEHDPTLWDFAFEKRVLLATPTNLIAIARTVAAVWRQEKLAAEAQKIGALGKEMHDRLAVAASKLKTVGSGLNTAVRNYNEFVSSFESRVMVTGRKFKDLNIETGARDLDELAPVEALARYGETRALAAPADPASITDEAAE